MTEFDFEIARTVHFVLPNWLASDLNITLRNIFILDPHRPKWSQVINNQHRKQRWNEQSFSLISQVYTKTLPLLFQLLTGTS